MQVSRMDTWPQRGTGKAGLMGVRTDVCTCSVWKRQLVGACCHAQKAQLGLCDDVGGWDAGEQERGRRDRE